MPATTTIGLIGAGAIGRAHLGGAAQAAGVRIVGVADPSPAAAELAREFGLPHFEDQRALRDALQPDGAVIATPNALHVPLALEWIAAGRPVLVEKPVAVTVEEGRQLARAAADAGVPVLVGHHRRHNPVLQKARALVQGGALGRLVCASVMAAFLKPDAYFEQAWRRSNAGGPVLINLIHEIDLLRFVCGEIRSLQALTSNAVRGFEVEDSAATLLRLENDALATIQLSDTAAAPWSWDLASGESPVFARSDTESHFLCGTEASLALPTLRSWRYPGERGWFHPLEQSRVAFEPGNPYVEQMRHFGAVIRREEAPLTDAADATRTLEVTLAVRQAARSGEVIRF
ncbi:Gfo/Idh/MocA family oxidoreductase [Ramlibacter sp. G-1-2-2]|uniref:Gfo/Idh/MocA family oxidoreductase n=1 Tax=Ramlibacter agri TaxID=2728837 RepID=A0A848HBM0_9BURK|nr:Gfo/Idh/MocA family oxidoreductase [Ramlibacter agri]NML47452.1 Gfo/Idh/MocA family oxidoreductase [Ramlibacter agri]